MGEDLLVQFNSYWELTLAAIVPFVTAALAPGGTVDGIKATVTAVVVGLGAWWAGSVEAAELTLNTWISQAALLGVVSQASWSLLQGRVEAFHEFTNGLPGLLSGIPGLDKLFGSD